MSAGSSRHVAGSTGAAVIVLYAASAAIVSVSTTSLTVSQDSIPHVAGSLIEKDTAPEWLQLPPSAQLELPPGVTLEMISTAILSEERRKEAVLVGTVPKHRTSAQRGNLDAFVGWTGRRERGILSTQRRESVRGGDERISPLSVSADVHDASARRSRSTATQSHRTFDRCRPFETRDTRPLLSSGGGTRQYCRYWTDRCPAEGRSSGRQKAGCDATAPRQRQSLRGNPDRRTFRLDWQQISVRVPQPDACRQSDATSPPVGRRIPAVGPSGLSTGEQGPDRGARHPDGKARRPRIPGVFKGGATPPAGMPRPRGGP
jgi:hypothetical protein